MSDRSQKPPQREEILVPEGSERRYVERVQVRDVSFEAVFETRNRKYTGRVLDFSAIGFLVEFIGERPDLELGHHLVLSVTLLGSVFNLQTVVRRIEGTRVALWLPEVVAGDIDEGVHLQDIVLKLKDT